LALAWSHSRASGRPGQGSSFREKELRAPEVSTDGSGYHLGNVVRFSNAHGFTQNYHSIYSELSQHLFSISTGARDAQLTTMPHVTLTFAVFYALEVLNYN
jgi:hypothetical protein